MQPYVRNSILVREFAFTLKVIKGKTCAYKYRNGNNINFTVGIETYLYLSLPFSISCISIQIVINTTDDLIRLHHSLLLNKYQPDILKVIFILHPWCAQLETTMR